MTYGTNSRTFTCVALVKDTCALRIVGRETSRSSSKDLVLVVLEQALCECGVGERETSLTHHSDRGVQYLLIRYADRLVGADIEFAVGSIGDSYDNALAKTIISLYKSELINRRHWRDIGEVEFATLERVDWFNNRRLFGPIGYAPPLGLEAEYERWERRLRKQHDSHQTASGKSGVVQSLKELGGY